MTTMKVIKNGKTKEAASEQKRLYKILSELPEPEKTMKLTPRQKKWWYWLGAELLQSRKLTKPDLIHLQKAAFWLDARVQAYQEIKELGYYDGLVQKFRSGATNVSAHITIIEKADKALNDFSAHFGLSIKDRVKLKQTKETNPDQFSLFEEFAMQKSAAK